MNCKIANVALLFLSLSATTQTYAAKDTEKSFDSLLLSVSTSQFSPPFANVFIDNNSAFKSKLQLIQSAKKSIQLNYFIFSDDHSTSALAQALIEKARQGVDVKILVDYHTNYKNLDFFRMLEWKGNGNLQVRFYNRPTPNILQDALYLTTDCEGENISEKQCQIIKKEKVNAIIKHANETDNILNMHTKYSAQFLAGLYSKDVNLLADAVFQGQKIDPKELFGQNSDKPSLTKEEKEGLKKLALMAYRAKTGNLLERKINQLNLLIASIKYKDTVPGIINTVSSILPTKYKGYDKDRLKDWAFITDYTHHKLLLVDAGSADASIQLGGRNLENSYHMDPNQLTNKYIFVDTDVKTTLDENSSMAIAQSFSELFNYRKMVASTSDVYQHANNDYLASKKFQPDTETSTIIPLETRLQSEYDGMTERALQYYTEYEPKDYLTEQPELASILNTNFLVNFDERSSINYLENLPYNRKETKKNSSAMVNPQLRTRLYGAIDGKESESGKNIHEVIVKSLQRVCDLGNKGIPQRVILHNAYVIPSGNILHQMGNMVVRDCKNVNVQIITNSMDTTDLNIVNIFAKYVMKAFFDFYKTKKDDSSATFEYYEYLPLSQDIRGQLSLHSKVFLIGDDVLIGSANMDIRSYMMDTNNGFYLRNVSDFSTDYQKYIDNILANNNLIHNITESFLISLDEMTVTDRDLINKMISQHNLDRYLTPERTKLLNSLLKKLEVIMRNIHQSSAEIVSKKYFTKDIEQKYNNLLKML